MPDAKKIKTDKSHIQELKVLNTALIFDCPDKNRLHFKQRLQSWPGC